MFRDRDAVGVLHNADQKIYIHLVTFRKEDSDFSPTTRYKDYLISHNLLHWQSQGNTARETGTGQNYLHFKEREYQVLFFARLQKKDDGETLPFIYLGPAEELISAEGDRPISMVWQLKYSVPAELFELARAV